MKFIIKKREVIPFFVTMIVFIPTIVSKIPVLNGIMSLLLNFVVIYMLIIWGMNKFRCSAILKHILLCFLLVILSTIINNNNILSTVIIYLKMFAMCYAMEWILKKKSSKFEMINVIKHAVAFYVIINMFSMIIFPDGVIQLQQVENEYRKYIIPWWIFGNKNAMFLWLYFCNILAQIDLIESVTKKKKIGNIMLIFITVVSSILSKSSTTIISIGVLSIFPFIKNILRKTNKIFCVKNYFIVYIMFTIIILSMKNVGFISLVASLFGKDTTFTGRVSAWMAALKMLEQSPFIGYGFLDAGALRELLRGFAFVNTHNAFLQLGIEGGFLLLVAVIGLGKVLMNKINNIQSNLKIFIEWAFLVLFIEISFEALVDSSFFWMIFVVFGGVCDLQYKGYKKDYE